MWLDAFLSVALVLVCIVASPVVATLGVPRSVVVTLGFAAIVCAVLLAGFGAITAIALMARMRTGEYHLPTRLRLPLPGPMRPAHIDGMSRRAVPGRDSRPDQSPGDIVPNGLDEAA